MFKKICFITLFFLTFVGCDHEITSGQIAAGPRTLDKNAVITGMVSVKEGLAPKGTGKLFIIVRPKGTSGGPPLAVAPVDDPVFPIGFRMSQANVMIDGNRFEGEVTLTAKWSKMGSPMAAVPGDLSTSKGIDVAVGTKDIVVVLDHEE